ncbi:MAG: VWA domain-containing protein [Chlamydiota bacterium]
MQWGHPSFLHALWLVAALALFLRWAAARRRRAIESFAEPALIGGLIMGLSVRRRRGRIAMELIALALGAVALAQPKWGYHWQRVTREGIDIVIAIDTSKSMLATDVKPDRLTRAKMEVSELLDRLQGDRVALVAFAGSSYILCPLTLDYSAVEMFLKVVRVGVVPLGGTDIGGAIGQAIRIFQGSEREHRALILLSDGEDLREGTEAAAKKAKELGVKIFSVGIGSPSGELIPVEGDEGGKSYLKDREGKVVQTRLNENTLQQAALLTGGSYVYPSAGTLGLVDLYGEKISGMEKKELVERQRKVYENRFQWPLAAAFLLLCLEAVLNDRARPKKDTA